MPKAQFSPAFCRAAETGPGGWSAWITGATPTAAQQFFFATQGFKNMVHSDPDWNYETFDLERDGKLAQERLAAALNATDPNLKAFTDRGGKLILYHGWNDAALPPVNTINYYQAVMATMGQGQADRFVRLFMVPGMQHCGGGPGPDSFGQSVTAMQSDPEHDLTLSLEQWVEQGSRRTTSWLQSGPRLRPRQRARGLCAPIRRLPATRAPAAPTTRRTSHASPRTRDSARASESYFAGLWLIDHQEWSRPSPDGSCSGTDLAWPGPSLS